MAFLALFVSQTASGNIPWKTARVTLQAVQQRTVADLIQELASKQGLQAIISPQVKAVASGDFQSVSSSSLLDTLCEVGNCTWFYDGGKIYVDAADEVLTRTLVVNALTRKSLEDALLSVGFASGPLGRESLVKGSDRPGLLLLAGGPRYIQATELVARELDAQMAVKVEQTGSEYSVRTYRLKYATAQDSTVGSGSGSSVRIPGVATTLQSLMNPKGSTPVIRSVTEHPSSGAAQAAVLASPAPLTASMIAAALPSMARAPCRRLSAIAWVSRKAHTPRVL